MQDTVFFVHMTDTHINIPGKNPLFKIDASQKRVMFYRAGKAGAEA